MITFDLTGKTAIVTGAAGGLGRAHALALSAHGARVVINDLGGGPGLDAFTVANEINASGGEAIADFTDITNFAAVRAMVAGVELAGARSIYSSTMPVSCAIAASPRWRSTISAR